MRKYFHRIGRISARKKFPDLLYNKLMSNGLFIFTNEVEREEHHLFQLQNETSAGKSLAVTRADSKF